MHFLSEQNMFVFLVQVFLLLLFARVFGELFRRFKQPPLTAEILVGVILGPTVLGRFAPGLYESIFPRQLLQLNMLETVAWLGVFFLLLESGLEIDFSSAWRQRGEALKIAIADVIIPMAIAFAASVFLPSKYFFFDESKRLIFAIFIATVMTISAMPITARALHDLRISKTDLAFLIMSALSVNDILGWLIFMIVLGVFIQGGLQALSLLTMAGFIIGFTVICLSFGKKLSNYVISRLHALKLPEPGSSLTFIVLLGFLCGAITQKAGIHALFGFFLAGIMAGEAKALSERTRQIISQMVYAIFVPLFFVNIGLKIDFFINFDIFLVLLFTIVGISARFIGAWWGSRIAAIEKGNRLAVSIAHIPGGVMEIVVALLALEYKLITEPVFVAIVFSAVFSSVILGPWLSYAIRNRKRVSILEFFDKNNVIPELLTNSRDEAILKLCLVAAEQEEISDVDEIYSAVLKRETAMGTGLEEGVAVPHARLDFLKRPIVIFGRSSSGIEWNSPDGQLTHFVFLILTPKDEDVQVQILSLISRALYVNKTREDLLKAFDAQAVHNILSRSLAAQGVISK